MSLDFESRVQNEQLVKAEYELLRRRASSNLLAYAKMIYPDYQINWHHKEIAQHLMLAEQGAIDRLMIFMPPRAGKSMLASTLFPAWYFGRNPSNQLIAASYASDLSSGFGSRIRNIMKSDEHKAVFNKDSYLESGSQAKDHFMTVSGGVYRAAGVGGGITGFGAHCFLIDDPVKNREDAESELMRTKAWDWYLNDVYTRKMKGAVYIVIMTRWHEGDLGGMLLQAEADGTGDKWVKLHYTAINEKNEALWPSMYPLEEMERTRGVVGPRTWQCLYQGDPIPDTGNYFKDEWIRYFDRMPDTKRMRIYASSDYAVTESRGDYTVHLIWGIDEHNDLYVLDMWRGQTSPDIWIEAFLDLVKRWKPILWGEERGQIDKAIGPFRMKRMQETGVYQGTKGYSSSHDKETRARSIQARIATGKVYFPKTAPWWSDFYQEMMKFPAGKNDDMVDTLSLAGRMLDTIYKGDPLPHEKTRPMGLFVEGDGVTVNRDGHIISPDGVDLAPGIQQVTYGQMIEDLFKNPLETMH